MLTFLRHSGTTTAEIKGHIAIHINVQMVTIFPSTVVDAFLVGAFYWLFDTWQAVDGRGVCVWLFRVVWYSPLFVASFLRGWWTF